MKNPFKNNKFIRRIPIFSTTAIQFIIFTVGLATNKLVAVYAGSSGIALFAVIKTFHTFFGGLLKLGSEAFILNAAAKAAGKKKDEVTILSSILRLFILQVVVTLFCLTFFDSLLFDLIFSTVMRPSFSWVISYILVLSLISVFSEMFLSFFNGLLDLKKVFIASLIGSLSTFVLAIYFRPFNYYELTFIALSSGLFSSITLLFFLYKDFFQEFRINLKSHFGVNIFFNLPKSLVLMIHPIAAAISLLIAQQIIGRNYGVDNLSFFMVVFMLINSGMTLMMSAVRMHFLPKLGMTKLVSERNVFFRNYVSLYIFLSFIAVLFLISFSGLIIDTLYSIDFIEAAPYLALMSSTVMLKAFLWIVAFAAWEKNRFNFYVITECIREFFFIIMCLFLSSLGINFGFIFLGIIGIDILISFFWIGYLWYFKEELSINRFFIFFVYSFTFLCTAFTYYRI